MPRLGKKLVLTLLSRYIEYQALKQQTGTLRTSFQKLSRLDDEQGTRVMYDHLGQAPGVDVHVYGVPDWCPLAEFGPTVHGVTDEELRNHWFVVYRAETQKEAAMVAIQTGKRTWNGYWTFDADDIGALDRYISETF